MLERAKQIYRTLLYPYPLNYIDDFRFTTLKQKAFEQLYKSELETILVLLEVEARLNTCIQSNYLSGTLPVEDILTIIKDAVSDLTNLKDRQLTLNAEFETKAAVYCDNCPDLSKLKDTVLTQIEPVTTINAIAYLNVVRILFKDHYLPKSAAMLIIQLITNYRISANHEAQATYQKSHSVITDDREWYANMLKNIRRRLKYWTPIKWLHTAHILPSFTCGEHSITTLEVLQEEGEKCIQDLATGLQEMQMMEAITGHQIRHFKLI